MRKFPVFAALMSLPINKLFGLSTVNISLLAELPHVRPTPLISCPVKVSEMLSVSGVRTSGDGCKHLDSVMLCTVIVM